MPGEVAVCERCTFKCYINRLMKTEINFLGWHWLHGDLIRICKWVKRINKRNVEVLLGTVKCAINKLITTETNSLEWHRLHGGDLIKIIKWVKGINTGNVEILLRLSKSQCCVQSNLSGDCDLGSGWYLEHLINWPTIKEREDPTVICFFNLLTALASSCPPIMLE